MKKDYSLMQFVILKQVMNMFRTDFVNLNLVLPKRMAKEQFVFISVTKDYIPTVTIVRIEEL